MISIQLLEKDDIVRKDDWIRPLQFRGSDFGDIAICKFSTWGGRPQDFHKWIRVQDALGDLWLNKSVKYIHKKLNMEYEFVRGDIPKNNIWNWRLEKDYQ